MFVRFISVSTSSTKIGLKITDSVGSNIPSLSLLEFSFHNNTLDTFFTFPQLSKFTIVWHILDGEIDSGKIDNLCVGHVFGIAGQSNAQGWSPPPFVTPQGNIRMLRNDSAWEAGEDPTGGMYASPWIQFANRLQGLLNDSLPIGIVNAAIGGTGLVTKTSAGWWQRNEALHDDIASVYGNALRKFLAAGAKFEALFWIQGESDCVGVTKNDYSTAFRQLINNFEEDLGVPIQVFHFQIGGQIGNPDKIDWGIIREAQRNLPLSTLVGTAVGNVIGWDGIHYSANTEIMVGDRFAGAIAKEIYSIPNNFYPPILPNNSAALEPCSFPYKGFKIVFGTTRASLPTELKVVDTLRGFQIRVNSLLLDTSRIFAKVESSNKSIIDIFLRDSSLMPNDDLQLSYALTGDVSNVNVTDNDSSTSVPNYLPAFIDIPVLVQSGVSESITLLPNIPNPFSEESSFHLVLNENAFVSYSVYSIDGRLVLTNVLGMMEGGSHLIQLERGSLVSGTYEIVFRIGSEIKTFKFIII